MLRVWLFCALIALPASLSVVTASEFGTKEEALSLVQVVQDKFKQQGKDETFSAINNRRFNDRDLFPFVYDLNGVIVATGGNAVLVGKNLISIRDQDGKYLVQEMIAIARGPGYGWINYKWPNPQTRKTEDKSTYVERMGDYLVAVGIYRF